MKRTYLLETIMTLLMAVALIIVSYSGAFVPGVYAYETTSFAIQGMGQDFFDLVIASPVLLVSWVLTIKGNKTGFFFMVELFYISCILLSYMRLGSISTNYSFYTA
ncbi:MAG: hypothetical protein ACFHWX_18785 [Bacteroidota bacterium]